MGAVSRVMRISAGALQPDHVPSPAHGDPCWALLPHRRAFLSGAGVESKRVVVVPKGDQFRRPNTAAVSLEATGIVPVERQQNREMENASAVLRLWTSLVGVIERWLLQILGTLVLPEKHRAVTMSVLIEKGVLGSGSFSLIAVAGCLAGSVLCFVKGFLIMTKSFLEHFGATSQRADQGDFLKLLIESLDMFLVGAAMLGFGMGLHKMIVGESKARQETNVRIAKSTFGLFDLAKLEDGFEIRSTAQAKLKLGHAIVLLLQAGMLESFKSVPMVSGMDLACMAGTVFFSSASVFILSKLL